MASLDVVTGMVCHPGYFCLDEEMANQNIPLDIGNAMMVNGLEVTFDAEFEDCTTKPCAPVQVDDAALVETILRNDSDFSVASACASHLENMMDYMCAESALKEQKLHEVHIEVTSWVEKKKLMSGAHDSNNGQLSSSAFLKALQNPTVRQMSPSITAGSNAVSLVCTATNKRIYRCSRCSFTHNELKEVAAHQATFHLPEKKSVTKPPVAGNFALNISKVNCPHCKQKHIIGRYSCRNCPYETMCPMELEKHMWDSHKSLHIYHCPCCTFISQTYMDIEDHLVKIHAFGKKDSSNTATEKSNEAKSKQRQTSRDSDRSTNAKVSLFNCQVCDFHSDSMEDLKLHVSKYHNRLSCMPFMCLLCGKEAFNKRGLELHSKSRHKAEPQCFALNGNSRKAMLAETETSCKDFLKLGLPNDRTSSTQWWCIVCGSGPQPDVYHLTPHIASHLCYTPYRCSICGLQFKLQLLANNHVKEQCTSGHVLVNAYLKKLQMSDVEILRKAVPLFNGFTGRRSSASAGDECELPYLCQICHYGCRTSQALLQHMYVHLSRKPFKCPVDGCDHTFTHKMACLNHVRKSHDKQMDSSDIIVNDYELEKQRKEGQSLLLDNTVHLPSVLIKKRFIRELEVCNICNLGPCGKAGLAIHIAYHSPQFPYQCGKCGEKYRQEIVAYTHASEMHRNQTNPIVKDEAAAAAQQQWVAEALKFCRVIAPEYSLKPIPKEEQSCTSLSMPPLAFKYANVKDAKQEVVLHTIGETGLGHRMMYRCKKCQLFTSVYGNCKNHVVTHLSHKPYKCCCCGARFRTAAFCRKHITSHNIKSLSGNQMEVVESVEKQQSRASIDLIEIIPVAPGKSISDVSIGYPVVQGRPKKLPTASPKKAYVCIHCNYEMSSKAGAKLHFLQKHAEIKPYSCKFCCTYEASCENLVISHVNKCHPEHVGRTDVVLTVKGKEKSLQKTVDRYLAHSSNINRKIALLQSTPVIVPEHYRAVCITSSGRSCIYKCSKCCYTARSVDAFKKHVQEHLGIEQYRCAHCDFSNDKQIYRHIRNIHGSKEEYDDVVETKAYIMLVTQMEDLAREVLLLDEKFHTEDGNDIVPDAFPNITGYTCICLHCQENFQSLVDARKHHREKHSTKQLKVDVDLCFIGASTDNKPKDDMGFTGASADKTPKDDDLGESNDEIKVEANSDTDSDDVPLAKKLKQEQKVPKRRRSASKNSRCTIATILQSSGKTKSVATPGPVGVRLLGTNSTPKTETPVSGKGKTGDQVSKVSDSQSAEQADTPDEASGKVQSPEGKKKQARKKVGNLKCHLCDSKLFNLTSLKRHFLISHTELRPYQCGTCDFVSHEHYEVKRHNQKKHDLNTGDMKIIRNEADKKVAMTRMRDLIKAWRAERAKSSSSKHASVKDSKLSMKPVVELDDIAKNPHFAKYFKNQCPSE